jgi:RimJ/RimL family protein N-acetyltransferase
MKDDSSSKIEGKVVFEGKTRSGKHLLIRYPKKGDELLLLNYINALSQEQTFIRFQGEKITLEEEEKYLVSVLEKIEKKSAVVLLAFTEEKLIGNTGLEMKDRVEKHEGVLGISVSADYRGEGVGKLLMELVMAEAEKNIADLRIITLGVFANNDLAKGMYEKFGFVQYGTLPKGVVHKGEFIDHIFMYKKIR